MSKERAGMLVDQDRLEEFCRRWSIAELALFGSLARGEAREQSDADVLVALLPGASWTIRDQLDVEAELREMFGRKVDVVHEYLIVNPFRRHNILSDKLVLFPFASTVDQIRDGAERFPRDIGLVWDIVRTGEKVVEGTAGMTFEEYRRDYFRRMAIERLLIIIGEASRAFSAEFRAAHPEIPWQDIIGERNILVHQYTKIDDEVVWRIATTEVPRLISELQPLLPPEPQ